MSTHGSGSVLERTVQSLTQSGAPDYVGAFQNVIQTVKDEGRYRTFAELERPADRYPIALWHSPTGLREVTIWCSNDYLNMGHHQSVRNAMLDAVQDGATGAGGTRNIGGTHHQHVQLESLLATLHEKEAALTFTSGWVANLTALTTLGQTLPDCVMLSDSKNHNSMIEGMRRSGAERIIFAHNDLIDLEQKLSGLPKYRAKIIVFESVYSMDGSVAPIAAMCDLAERYGALTYLDEVHAVGMYGATGGGQAQAQDVAERIDIIQGTLGKAFGLFGGYIAGRTEVIDCIRTLGAGFIFSTALPPVIAAGVRASITHLMKSGTERAAQVTHVTLLKHLLTKAGIPFLDSPSHIVPVMVGQADLCKRISDELLNSHGIYVQSINYPTVARGTERLRFTPGPKHTPEMLEALVRSLSQVWNEFGLKRSRY